MCIYIHFLHIFCVYIYIFFSFYDLRSLDLDLQATQKFFDGDDDDGERQRSFKRKDSISLAKWTSDYPITIYGKICFSLLIYRVTFTIRLIPVEISLREITIFFFIPFFNFSTVRIYHLHNWKKSFQRIKLKVFLIKKIRS